MRRFPRSDRSPPCSRRFCNSARSTKCTRAASDPTRCCAWSWRTCSSRRERHRVGGPGEAAAMRRRRAACGLLIDFFELYGRRINTDDVGYRAAAADDSSPSAIRSGRTRGDRSSSPLRTRRIPRTTSDETATREADQVGVEHAFTVLTAPVGQPRRFSPQTHRAHGSKTLRARKPPERPGAIAGVAADFERYARAAADEDGARRRRRRGRRRAKAKSGATPAERPRPRARAQNRRRTTATTTRRWTWKTTRPRPNSGLRPNRTRTLTRTLTRLDPESSSDGSEEEGQVAKRRKPSGGAAAAVASSRRPRRSRRSRRTGWTRRARARRRKPSGRGGHKTPAGKKRRKGDGGGGRPVLFQGPSGCASMTRALVDSTRRDTSTPRDATRRRSFRHYTTTNRARRRLPSHDPPSRLSRRRFHRVPLPRVFPKLRRQRPRLIPFHRRRSRDDHLVVDAHGARSPQHRFPVPARHRRALRRRHRAPRSAPRPRPVLRLATTRPPGASALATSNHVSSRVSSGNTLLFSSKTSTMIPANRRPSRMRV